MSMAIDPLEIVLTNTYTVVDVHQRLALLKEFFEHAFYAGAPQTPTVELFDTFSPSVDFGADAVAAVRAWSQLFGVVTSGTLYQYLNQMAASLTTIPVLTLYMAVRMPVEEIPVLGEKIRNVIGAKVLVDMHLQPHLYAGCAFVWNDRYYDYSLPRLLERKRDALTNLVSSHA